MADTQETLLGYWLGWVQGPSLEQTPASVTSVALAFAMPNADNSLDFSELLTDYTPAVIRQGADALRDRGVTVLLSIGGSTVTEWPDLDPVKFAANVVAALEALGCDGVDLDNEGDSDPGENFIAVIEGLRAALGPDAPITLPVYLGPQRDAYLAQVADQITAVYTMAYWNGYQAQIELFDAYAALVGAAKTGIGVADCASPPSSNTDFAIVPRLAQFGPKAGMMLWNLNASSSAEAHQWCDTIAENLYSG